MQWSNILKMLKWYFPDRGNHYDLIISQPIILALNKYDN